LTILLLRRKFVCVARKLRVEYPGAVHHVVNRGDRREPIFKSDQDRALCFNTLAESCQKTDWEVHALCQETTMTLCWIAQRLNMAIVGSLANLLRDTKMTVMICVYAGLTRLFPNRTSETSSNFLPPSSKAPHFVNSGLRRTNIRSQA
jgi:hypothetical protein